MVIVEVWESKEKQWKASWGLCLKLACHDFYHVLDKESHKSSPDSKSRFHFLMGEAATSCYKESRAERDGKFEPFLQAIFPQKEKWTRASNLQHIWKKKMCFFISYNQAYLSHETPLPLVWLWGQENFRCLSLPVVKSLCNNSISFRKLLL